MHEEVDNFGNQSKNINKIEYFRGLKTSPLAKA